MTLASASGLNSVPPDSEYASGRVEKHSLPRAQIPRKCPTADAASPLAHLSAPAIESDPNGPAGRRPRSAPTCATAPRCASAHPATFLVRRAAPDHGLLRRNRVKGRQGARLRRALPLDTEQADLRCPQGTGRRPPPAILRVPHGANGTELPTRPFPDPRERSSETDRSRPSVRACGSCCRGCADDGRTC